LSNLRPTIYFSKSLKEQLKYFFGKKFKKDKLEKYIYGKFNYDINTQKVECIEYRHNYLKTKTQLLLYRKDHEIKTNYHKKYDEKDLYTATLIPEYGSWIRFGFQKNTKINSYKYPVKNQEDEITIQLDKINQKPIIDLFKEMGLTDLDIYQNLQSSDFFYFDQPLLINSKFLNQPIARFDLDVEYFKNISEFSRIFDPNYFRLGRVGRLKLNNRLNLKITNRLQIITYEDIFAIIDKLINLTISKAVQDDIDHLKKSTCAFCRRIITKFISNWFSKISSKITESN
jgi:DNA-directed RNA polymerase beta subunit